MEHSLGLIAFWATNQDLVTLRKLKSYQASFLITMLYQWKTTTTTKKKTAKKHKHMETKQHATKQPMDH